MFPATHAYLVLGYFCNQKCFCCPIEYRDGRVKTVPFSFLKEQIDSMVSYGVSDVTMSGGEPTLHPSFFDIVEYALNKGLYVHILTNGERLNNKQFLDEFVKRFTNKKVAVTTTFHSHIAEEHEYQNQTKGSFLRSLNGLKELDDSRINIAIKHCITKYNYRQLPEYIDFINKTFSERIEIQLWGIDLCGIDLETSNAYFVPYKEVTPYLEKCLDLFENSKSQKGFTINNFPLCSVDPYFWKYFTRPNEGFYIDHEQQGKRLSENSGPGSKNCSICPFNRYCLGTYLSNFEMMGDDIVEAPSLPSMIARFKYGYRFYDNSNINSTFFSPYVESYLDNNGFNLVNIHLNTHVVLRLKSAQIAELYDKLSNGITDDNLVCLLNSFNFDGNQVVDELFRKGIIE